MGRLGIEERAKKMLPRLARRCGWTREMAFWKLANLWWDSQELLMVVVDREDLIDFMDIPPDSVDSVASAMCECGYLEKYPDGGWKIKGNEDHVAKISNLRENGKAGAKITNDARANKKGGNCSATAAVNAEPNAAANGSASARQTSSTAQHSSVQHSTEEGGPGETEPTNPRQPLHPSDVRECIAAWHQTLAKFNADRPLMPSEEIEIARKVREVGKEFVVLAMLGAQVEKGNDEFHPQRFLTLARVFRPDGKPTISAGGTEKKAKAGFSYFVNLGTQAMNAEKAKAAEFAARASQESIFENPAEDELEERARIAREEMAAFRARRKNPPPVAIEAGAV